MLSDQRKGWGLSSRTASNMPPPPQPKQDLHRIPSSFHNTSTRTSPTLCDACILLKTCPRRLESRFFFFYFDAKKASSNGSTLCKSQPEFSYSKFG
uniref:Uncharacterized protein n=1 Tax=Physcomitrium patens TaxID=3218 RepID=A0A2K1IAK1_PHYPA|nr:hypothetical protein PHYPA_030879 [Physcomitrium patens]